MGLLHQNAASRRANFALIDEDAEQRAVDCGFKVRIGEKDVRGLAAEFEGDALHGFGCLADNDLANFSAAGECDLVYVGMLDQRRAATLPYPVMMLTTPGGSPTSGNHLPFRARSAASAPLASRCRCNRPPVPAPVSTLPSATDNSKG